MADVVVKNTDTNNSVPNKKSKKWLFILPILFIIVIAAAIGGWIYNVNSKQIKLGGETINKKAVDAYSKEIETYYKNNSLNLTESSRKKAKDDLLMHAALKEKAIKYKVNISQSDLDSEMASIYNTYGGKSKFSLFAKPEGVYNYLVTNSENEIYKKKLEDKILQRKTFFILGINIDTPYFNKVSTDQRIKLINESKKKIQDKYYILFQKNTDSKTIANSFLSENKPYYLDYEHESTRNSAYVFDCSVKLENCFNDLPDYDVAGAVYTTSKIKNLKKGQYTDVFVSKAGFVGVIRLDDILGEKYASWNDFLDQYNRQYKNKLIKMN